MKLPANRPVNADARAIAVPCFGSWARAGYRNVGRHEKHGHSCE